MSDDTPKSRGCGKLAFGCGVVVIALIAAPFFEVVQLQIIAMRVGAIERGPAREGAIRELWDQGPFGQRALAGLFRAGDHELREDICRDFDWSTRRPERSSLPEGFEPLLSELLELFATTTDDDVTATMAVLRYHVAAEDFAEAILRRLELESTLTDDLATTLSMLPEAGLVRVVQRLTGLRNREARAILVTKLVARLHSARRVRRLPRTQEALKRAWSGWPDDLRADFERACERVGRAPPPLGPLLRKRQ